MITFPDLPAGFQGLLPYLIPGRPFLPDHGLLPHVDDGTIGIDGTLGFSLFYSLDTAHRPGLLPVLLQSKNLALLATMTWRSIMPVLRLLCIPFHGRSLKSLLLPGPES